MLINSKYSHELQQLATIFSCWFVDNDDGDDDDDVDDDDVVDDDDDVGCDGI
jgi:hypothetical protein